MQIMDIDRTSNECGTHTSVDDRSWCGQRS